MSTRMPLPAARNAVPRAAVVLPLPGPVLMRISPRREGSIISDRRTQVWLQMFLVAGVIGMSGDDGQGAVDLFGEDDAGELMRQRHRPEGEKQVSAGAGGNGPSVRGTDGEHEILGAGVAKTADLGGKILGGEHPA